MRRGGRQHTREITWLDHLVLSRREDRHPREITWFVTVGGEVWTP